MPSRSAASLTLLASLLVSACHFQDLTPGSTRRDEAAVQVAVTAFYQALGTHDSASLGRVVLPASGVLVASDQGMAVLVPMRSIIALQERRGQGGGARVARSELHMDGNVASDRAGIVARSTDGRREYEATDVLMLAKRGRDWRIAEATFGPWRARSAP